MSAPRAPHHEAPGLTQYKSTAQQRAVLFAFYSEGTAVQNYRPQRTGMAMGMGPRGGQRPITTTGTKKEITLD